MGEARKAKRKAAPQAEENLENPEGMAEPMARQSAESSGAITPHAREEACKNGAAQSASHPAKTHGASRDEAVRGTGGGVHEGWEWMGEKWV